MACSNPKEDGGNGVCFGLLTAVAECSVVGCEEVRAAISIPRPASSRSFVGSSFERGCVPDHTLLAEVCETTLSSHWSQVNSFLTKLSQNRGYRARPVRRVNRLLLACLIFG